MFFLPPHPSYKAEKEKNMADKLTYTQMTGRMKDKLTNRQSDFDKIYNMFEANGVDRPAGAARAILTRVAAGDITQAQAMTLARKKVREAKGEKTMSEDEYKSKTDLRNQKTFGEGRTLDKKRGGKAKNMMGGGKVHSKYTSGNKRYANGGKIYPMVGK